jgi:hypothetical protein
MGTVRRKVLSMGPVTALAVALLLSSAVLTVAYEPPALGSGEVTSPANGTTVVTSQGWNAGSHSLPGRPARLAAVGPNGSVNWTHDGPDDRRNWFYDVDPLPNGNLLVVNPVSGSTVVYEFDPDTQERVWTEEFDSPDIHDVDRINGDELLVAGINYEIPSRDRVFVYNRTTGETTWNWSFREHYPNDVDGGADSEDWTHVNDVDRIREGEFLVSVRNFDQVIVLNRSTKEIDLRLGADGDHDTMYEQHNPQYLESDDGTPTILVADSENARVVEYERVGGPPGDGEWERVWSLSNGLAWPRDADRLPNGNTLVVDSMNHRVIEVTPDGEIVWETSVPWATYDAERVAHGDEGAAAYDEPSDAPTMRDLGSGGSYELHNGSPAGVPGVSPVPAVVGSVSAGSPFSEFITGAAKRFNHLAPWGTPTWMPNWSALLLITALGILLGRAVGKRGYGIVSRAVF